MNIELIKKQAQEELKQEAFREAVGAYKQKLKRRKWWHKLIPYRVIILRRDV